MPAKIRQLAASFVGAIIRIVILIIALVSISKIGKTAYDFGFRIFTEKAVDEHNGRDISVTVSKNDKITDIAEKLEEKGVIRDSKLFIIQEKLSEHKGKVEPGVYSLNTSMTTDQIISVLYRDESEEEQLSQPDALVEHTDSTITPLGNSTISDSEDGNWEGSEETGESGEAGGEE